MKARRDLGVHNDWRINDTYKRKIKESGFPGLPNQLYMYPSEEYIDVCLKLAESIYRKVYEHILQKYS